MTERAETDDLIVEWDEKFTLTYTSSDMEPGEHSAVRMTKMACRSIIDAVRALAEKQANDD